MALKIYNTLTREKELFEPLESGRVNMYVCGPTVYDYPHIGHAKTYVSFDVVVRYLRHLGYDVLYVQNITDVGHLTDDADTGEDKILKRARERRVEPMQLVETYTREYFAAMDALNVLRPDISPRATGHIPEIIALCQRLIEEGHAYEVDGSVYFDVGSFPEYGRLSNRRLEDQESSGRIEIAAGKRDPADFALWKKAEPSHLMRWPSPWGEGYPGWHIECSAMAMKYLGETLDLHGGGVDNIFPHNEDEIAQSECATHKPFVRYWMHTGTLRVDGVKMSKSLGNFTTVGDAIRDYGAELMRFFIISSHYRSPLDYSKDGLRDAGRAFERLQIAIQNADRFTSLPVGSNGATSHGDLDAALQGHQDAFFAAMDEDFNTPAAIGALFELVTTMNGISAVPGAVPTPETREAVAKMRATLVELAGILGLSLEPKAGAGESELVPGLVELLLEMRQLLRGKREFAAADRVRDGLKELGVVVEDRPEGPTWRVAGR
jgi:cysteinyl-tRNA synthetase